MPTYNHSWSKPFQLNISLLQPKCFVETDRNFIKTMWNIQDGLSCHWPRTVDTEVQAYAPASFHIGTNQIQNLISLCETEYSFLGSSTYDVDLLGYTGGLCDLTAYL